MAGLDGRRRGLPTAHHLQRLLRPRDILREHSRPLARAALYAPGMSAARWLGTAGAAAVLAATPAQAGPRRVVLGAPLPRCVPHWSAYCGYGSSTPRYLPSPESTHYVGDLSSEIGHRIRWTRWGEPVAFGIGVAWTATPNGGMYPKPLLVRLRAFDIGRCMRDGALAYRRLQVRNVWRPGGPLHRWRDVPSTATSASTIRCPRPCRYAMGPQGTFTDAGAGSGSRF